MLTLMLDLWFKSMKCIMDCIRDHIATLVQQYDVLVLLLLNISVAFSNPNRIAIPLAPQLPSARFFGSMVWSQEANERSSQGWVTFDKGDFVERKWRIVWECKIFWKYLILGLKMLDVEWVVDLLKFCIQILNMYITNCNILDFYTLNLLMSHDACWISCLDPECLCSFFLLVILPILALFYSNWTWKHTHFHTKSHIRTWVVIWPVGILTYPCS